MSSARKRALVLVAVAVVAVGAIVAIAAAGSSNTDAADRAATNAFLRTRLALLQSFTAGLPAGEESMNVFVAEVRSKCSGALRGAPVSAGSDGSNGGFTDQGQLALEGLSDLAIAQRGVDTAAVERFASALRRLRWHDRHLTALVHTFAQIETERAHMRVPDLCGQIKAWVASGYRTLPQTTSEPREQDGMTLTRELAALGCTPFDQPEHAVVAALRRYQRAGEQPTTRQVELTEFRLNIEALKAALTASVALEHALDLHLPPKKHKRRLEHESKSRLPAPYPACSGQPEPVSEPVGA